MKKELCNKKNEPLHEWVSRIAPLCANCNEKEIMDVLLEAFRQGYICGVHDTNDINTKKK